MSCTSPLIRIDYESNKYRLARLFDQLFIDQFLKKVHNGGYFLSEKNLLTYYPDYYMNDELSEACIRVPCGQCIECRLASSREWALRIMLEAQAYEHNYFLTLTYNDDNLPLIDEFDTLTGELVPDVPTLDKSALSGYIKRLRDHVKREYGVDGVRFFGCGEYGELYGRPHYHVCLMNMPDLSDDLVFFKREGDINLYRSSFLESSWLDKTYRLPLGFSTVGELTWDSAAYTARYIMKKQLGKSSAKAFLAEREALDLPGSVIKQPEFVLMSRRPGIARQYYVDHSDELYDHDTIVAKFGDRVYQVKPPRYFDTLYDNVYSDLDHARRMQQLRIDRAKAGTLSLRSKLESTDLTRAQDLNAAQGRVLRRERRSHRRSLDE